MFQRLLVVPVAVACLGVSLCRLDADEAMKFDVSDVAWLWPPPTTADDVGDLVSGDRDLGDGDVRLFPQDAFDAILSEAKSVEILGANGTRSIKFSHNEIEQPATWKLAAVRIDPSAPGTSPKLQLGFGEVPQIRLILQPVTIADGKARVHDIAAHLVYSFVKPSPPSPTGRPSPPTADKERFSAVVADLKSLKKSLLDAGVDTSGKPLGVHPAFGSDGEDVFRETALKVLGTHLKEGTLNAVAFMGVDGSEPWIFLAVARGKRGEPFGPVPHSALGGKSAQMLSFRDAPSVVPEPTPGSSADDERFDTATLFDTPTRLESPVREGQDKPLRKDIPDLVANPTRCHFFNTDCISCHTESARRKELQLSDWRSEFRYAQPQGISAVDPQCLPASRWNVRNFGWFRREVPTPSPAVPTVTMRTANETAESVEYLNATYLSPAP